MVESNSCKIEWSIKKDVFLSGNLHEKLVVGTHTWCLSSDYENPLEGDTVSLMLSCRCKRKRNFCALYGCWQTFGIICLKGVGGFQVMKPWIGGGRRSIQLKVDNSVFSFDEKYLFPDGTYRIELTVEQRCSIVDFESPDHALILGPSDGGCLEIEGKKLFVSKSYFSAQSPYFKALFFGDFKEKNQEVIVLNDVEFYTFKEFLKHLYFEFHEQNGFDETAISEVVALADMFLCDAVMRSCENVLAEEDSFTIADLELADKYRLQKLKVKAVAQLPIDELKTYLTQILDSPESLYTRLFIMDRIKNEHESGR